MSVTLNRTAALQAIVGAAGVSERAGRSVVAPKTTEEIAAVMRLAHRDRLAIEIAGAGTKRGWGSAVDAAVVLDMTGLSGVREHVWQDLTATVAAGTVWSELTRALAVQHQRIALDPLWPERATVGGIIATNDSGGLRSRYGSLRDLIIGMTVVLADGTIAKTGGKVVKNVAGYDLHKLMTGAFGTLGVIAEVTFRLHPSPKSTENWSVTAEEIAPLEAIRHRLADSAAAFEALQLRTRHAGYALDVALTSVPECIQELSERFRALVAPLQVVAAGNDVWEARERCFAADKAVVKLTMSPTAIAEVLTEVNALGGRCVAQQCGVAMAALPPDAASIAALRERTVRRGGSLTLLQWPGEAADRPDLWGDAGSALALMREIKQRFDPNRILNPGRFVGGL